MVTWPGVRRVLCSLFILLIIVADRLTGQHDRPRQHGFGQDAPRPERFQKLLFAHGPIRIAQQIEKYLKRFALYRGFDAMYCQAPRLFIQLATFEPPCDSMPVPQAGASSDSPGSHAMSVAA